MGHSEMHAVLISISVLLTKILSTQHGHLGCYPNGVFDQKNAAKYMNVSSEAIDSCVWDQRYTWQIGCKIFSCHLEGNNICIPYKIQSICDRVVFKNGGKRHCYKAGDGCGGFIALFKKDSIYSRRGSETCDNYYWVCRRNRSRTSQNRRILKDRRRRRKSMFDQGV